MRGRRLRVIKVGGSLLTFDRLEEALRMWLDSQARAASVFVVGGGAAADAIREVSRDCGLADDEAHWLAIRAMSQSANVLHALFPEARKAASLASIRAAGCDGLWIVDPLALLRNESVELGPERLPHSWAATSDSIAARIAEAVSADELVLLKSCSAPEGRSWQEAAEAGYVDAYFPVASAQLRNVRAVNLREACSTRIQSVIV